MATVRVALARRPENNQIVHNKEAYKKAMKPIEENIKKLVAERDQLNSQIRDLTIQHDVMKRQIQTRTLLIDDKEKLVKQKVADAAQSKQEITACEQKNEQAKQDLDRSLKEIQTLRDKLDQKYREIADAMVQCSQPISKASQERTQRVINMLKESIAKRKESLSKTDVKSKELETRIVDLEREECELNQARNEIKERFTSVEAQRFEKLQVLAEPIDSLSYETSIAEMYDKDVASLEEKFLKMGKIDDDDSDDAQVMELERMNAQRKTQLSRRREILEQSKTELAQRDHIDVKKARKIALDVEKIQTDSVKSLVETMQERLLQRQQKVKEDEAEIDKLCEKNKEVRRDMTAKWQEKAELIDSLNQQIAELESLTADIHMLSEQNDVDAEKSRELEQKIAQLKRRIDNIERDKNRNQSTNSLIARLRKRLQDKQKAVDEMEAELNERREQLEIEEAPLNELEKATAEKETQVNDIEAQVKQTGAQVEATVKQFKDEKEKLDELLATLPNDEQDKLAELQALLAGAQ